MHPSRCWLYSFTEKNLNKKLPKHYFDPPKPVWNLFKVNNKKISFVVLIANFQQAPYLVHASVTSIYVTKNSCNYILDYKEKFHNFSKILEKYMWHSLF